MFNSKEKALLNKIISERIRQNWGLTESTYLPGSKKYDEIVDENNDLKLFSQKYSISLPKDIRERFLELQPVNPFTAGTCKVGIYWL